MELVIVFLVTTILCVLLRNPIKKCSVAFYVLAVAAVVVLLAGTGRTLDGTAWKCLITLVQHCEIAFSLFVVVMLIGVLPQGSKMDAWLRPVRGELSIIAFILCLGHAFAYLASYLGQVVSGEIRSFTLIALIIALVIFALLVVLGVTSFKFVKKRMETSSWKRIQKLSYLFFGLVYAHLMLMFLPSAANGGKQAIVNMAVYTCIMGTYAVLRLWKRRIAGMAASSLFVGETANII